MHLDQLLQGGSVGAEPAPSVGADGASGLLGQGAAGETVADAFSNALALLADPSALDAGEASTAASLVPEEGTGDAGTPSSAVLFGPATDAQSLPSQAIAPVVTDAAIGEENAAPPTVPGSSPGLGEGDGLPSGGPRVAHTVAAAAVAPAVVNGNASSGASGEALAGGSASSAHGEPAATPGRSSVAGAAATIGADVLGDGDPASTPKPTSAGTARSAVSAEASAAGEVEAAARRSAGNGTQAALTEPETESPVRQVVPQSKAESDAVRPAPATTVAPAARTTSEQASTVVASASRPRGDAAAHAESAAASGEPSRPRAEASSRTEITPARGDGTSLAAMLGDEEPTSPAVVRGGSESAIDPVLQSIARDVAARPLVQRPVQASGAPAGGADSASAPVTQSAASSAPTSPTSVLARVDQPQGFAALAERIVDALHLSAVRGGSEIRLRVEPHGLGHIDVRVQLQDDGVRAMIVAEHEATRALISGNQHLLEAALGRSELRLSGFSVDLGLEHGGMDFHETGQELEQDAEPSPFEHAAREGESVSSDPREAAVAPGRLSLRV